MIPDVLKPVELRSGAGAPGMPGCWMSTLQAYIGGRWTDRCLCVDPVIRTVCIIVNDGYRTYNEQRTTDIMTFGLLRPLNTVGGWEHSSKRMLHVLDTAIRKWIPDMLDGRGPNADADVLRALPVIDSLEAVLAVTKRHNDLMYLNSCDVRRTLFCAALALNSTSRVDQLGYVEEAVHEAICASYASRPDSADRRVFLRDRLLPLIGELIELGPHDSDHVPEPANGVEEFHRQVGVRHDP